MMDKQAKDKVIQLLQAPADLWAEVRDDCGYRKEVKVICLGLMKSGQVRPMVINGGGICPADDPYLQYGPRPRY